MNILVTGGCGFIGSRMIRYLLDQTPHSVVNVDSLTYAGTKGLIFDGKHWKRKFFVEYAHV